MLSYTYDQDGRRLSLAINDIATVSYTHDDKGRIEQIQLDNQCIADFAYNLTGERKQTTFANDVQQKYEYDPAGRISRMTLVSPGNTQSFFETTYGYDLRDRRVWQTRNNSYGDRFSYRADGQLVGYGHDIFRPDLHPNGAPAWYDSFTYDAGGNRSLTTEGGTASNYTVNALNQYTTVDGCPLDYGDAQGNLTGFGAFQYHYDLDNRLTKIAQGSDEITFDYDAAGRAVRINRLGETEIRVFDGSTCVMGITDEATVYIRGDDHNEILAAISLSNGTTKFHHNDVTWNLVCTTDTLGHPFEYYLYDPFGSPDFRSPAWNQQLSSTIGSQFLFQGKEWFEFGAIYDFQNRAYMPRLGRFQQVDPLGFEAGDLNLYRYCFNDPINHIDPDGRFVFLAPLAIYAGKMVVDYAVEKGLEYVKDNHLSESQRVWAERVELAHSTYKLATGNARQITKTIGSIANNKKTKELISNNAKEVVNPSKSGNYPDRRPWVEANPKTLKPKTADSEIPNSLKRSDSYHSELGGYTRDELQALKDAGGDQSNAAGQMLKLIKEQKRLLEGND